MLLNDMMPKNLDDMIGQEHLLGKNKPLRRIIESGIIPNLILYGPSGTGKTSFANVVANISKKKFVKLNGTTATIKDIQNVVSKLDMLEGCNGIILFMDEIQGLSKAQMKVLLSYIDSGEITLVASTTSNPYHAILGSIISRSLIFNFKPISSSEMVNGMVKYIDKLISDGKNVKYEKKALNAIADMSKGDLRKAFNLLETLINISAPNEIIIDIDSVIEFSGQSVYMDESVYYDFLSMMHKSIRGSDVDAALLSMGVLLNNGKIDEVIRRLLVIGAEDCFATFAKGSMYSNLYALVNAASMVGLPEAQIILSNAVVLLASAPKSNACYKAIMAVMNDLKYKDIGEIQPYLRDGHYKGAKNLGVEGYKNPHDYKNNYVEQEYMTSNMIGKKYYIPGDNRFELAVENYWRDIKNNLRFK